MWSVLNTRAVRNVGKEVKSEAELTISEKENSSTGPRWDIDPLCW